MANESTKGIVAVDGGLAQGEAGRDRRKGTESKKHEKVCPWTEMGYGGQK